MNINDLNFYLQFYICYVVGVVISRSYKDDYASFMTLIFGTAALLIDIFGSAYYGGM